MPSDAAIIDLSHFIEATRDSGYKSTTSAIAELVDNSIQAGAGRVEVDIVATDDKRWPVQVMVTDDGCGMRPTDLRRSLQFGGSSRFGNREGLGRYGMGLPNASLSQCRRVEVVSWTSRTSASYCWLDVDEIVSGKMAELPNPVRCGTPGESESGTVVHWIRCDRLDNVRISTLERKITAAIARMFRHFIWKGIKVLVNGKAVPGIDPTYLNPKSPLAGATRHGDVRHIQVRPTPESPEVGTVAITFSRLPLSEWSSLDNPEKRRRGIANGAGVSVVRGGREIEYGWHFMGSKRRENYDDWWRCEVSFDPILDEAFGITHTKQQIRPRDHLLEAIVPEIEATAKSLNGAVRREFQELKSTADRDPLEQSMVRIEPKLPPIAKRRANDNGSTAVQALRDRHPMLRVEPPAANGRAGEYRVVEDATESKALFDVHTDGGRVIVVLNKKHPFYQKELGKHADGAMLPIDDVREMFERLVLAAARAELSLPRSSEVQAVRTFRETWGHTLALLTAK